MIKLRKYIRGVLLESLSDKCKTKHTIQENKYNVFHGTNEQFGVFDYGKIGYNTDSSWNGYGFYFSNSKTEASLYGKKIISANITLNNPLDLTKIKDTSVQGSGIVRLFSKIKGLSDIKKEGYSYKQIGEILDNLENNFDVGNISYSDGSNNHFKHVWYNHNGKEYVIRNRTDNEINDKNWIKSLIISTILHEKYNIGGLPIRIKEAVSPHVFTKIAKENGYDGVINYNSTTVSGNEYVVFDNKNIQITS